MDQIFEDRFDVFIREDEPHTHGRSQHERPLVSCATYEEAQWVRREYAGPHRKCIIRFVGPAGGGD